MKKLVLPLLALVLLCGCATCPEGVRCFLGVSTKELEAHRKDALVKVFDYDYDTCYARMEKIIRDMAKTQVYAQDTRIIAFYYIDPNVTPVGVFFTAVDSGHTKVEVSSEGPAAKEWVAKNLFSETVLPATSENKYGKQGDAGTKMIKL